MTNYTDQPIRWSGQWQIQVKDAQTGEIRRDETLNNHIMNTSLEAMSKTLMGTAPDIAIQQLAIGTDSTPVTDSQTGLITEAYRTSMVVTAIYSATGKIQTEFYLTSTEGNMAIEEIGIFGGTAATTASDTGTLLSRILWSHTKTSSEEISFIRVDTIGRG